VSAEELYGLLVPLLDERLLVPRACVAEVTSFQPLQEMPGAPPWYLGIQAWNGRGVPVVSFEGTCGKRIPVVGGRTRIVIFTCLGQKLPAGHFGIATQGFPQLVRVNGDVLGLDTEQPVPAGFPALCRARMIHEYPLIPDVEQLEKMIAAIPV